MKEVLLQLNYAWASIDAEASKCDKDAVKANTDMARCHYQAMACAYRSAGAEIRKVIVLSLKIEIEQKYPT